MSFLKKINWKTFLLSVVLVSVSIGGLLSLTLPSPVFAESGFDSESLKKEGLTTATPNQTAVQNKISCSLWSLDLLCRFGQLVFGIIYIPLMALLWFAAAMLDYAIDMTQGFSALVSGDTAITGIRVAWAVFRDGLTMSFIFMLLYAGIKMILGLSGSEKIIKSVIIAGLFINFSFFFTSIIIDTSNLFVVKMHEAIVTIGQKSVSNGPYIQTNSAGNSKAISGLFMNSLGVRLGPPKDPRVLTDKDFDNQLLLNLFYSSATFLIAAFVFLVMAFLLIFQKLMFIMLLITSAIAVMDSSFPQLGNLSKSWRQTLISQAVFAPAMMLGLVITSIIITDEHFTAGFVKQSHAVGIGFTGAEDIGTTVQFAIVIGLLIGSVVMAKQIAGSAGGATAKLSGWAGKLAFGGAAAAGAYGVGQAGKALANSDWANKLKASDKWYTQGLGAGIVGTGKYVGNASFDVRGTAAGKWVGAGKAAPGYLDRLKQTKKEREEAAKQVKENMDDRAKEAAKKRLEEEQLRFDNIDNEIKDLESKRRSALSDVYRRADLSPEEKEKARREALELKDKLDEAKKIKAKGKPKSETEARTGVQQSAAAIGAGGIGAVNAAVKEMGKEIGEIIKGEGTETAKRERVANLLRTRLSENQVKYYNAMEELVAVEKRKERYEKEYKAQWAATTAVGQPKAIVKTADEVRKELNKSKETRALETVKKALEKEGLDEFTGGAKTEGATTPKTEPAGGEPTPTV